MFEMTNKKEENFKESLLKLGVDLVLIFGSRADGTSRPDSDFDIAYRSKKPLEFGDIFSVLTNYIGSDNLHILDIHMIKPLTLYEIMRNCKVLHAENMMDFYNLRAYSFRRFEDEVKPLYENIFNRLKIQYIS